RDRRREPVRHLLEDRLAATRAGDTAARRLVLDQRTASIRRDLRLHARGSVDGDDRRRLLPLSAGLQFLRSRLRRGDRLCPLRRNPPAHRAPALDRSPPRALRLMTEHALQLPEPAARTWRRFVPSPRHALLLPLSLLMLTPLLWMLLTSIQTPAESRQFPPVLPSGI